MNSIKLFLEKGFLINPDVMKDLEQDTDLLDLFADFKGSGPIVITKDIITLLKQSKSLGINWLDFEKARVLHEKKRDVKVYKTFLELLDYDEKKQKFDRILEEVSKPTKIIEGEEEKVDSSVVVLKQYEEEPKTKEVKDFIDYYRLRYSNLSMLLKQRTELLDVISINRLRNKTERDSVSLIGLVSNIEKTKNNNIIMTIEDLTGSIKVLINSNKPDLYEKGNFLVFDEIIGVKGNLGNNIVFANELFFPDFPITSPVKKCDDDVYAVFTADFHIGSKYLYENAIIKFIRWLNYEAGTTEQKEVAKKVKYLFVVGDLVEGIGIYPGQDNDLKIKDIYKQYDKFAEFFSLIRKDVEIIICPGNHDALRLAEPQPLLDEKYAKSLYDLPNVTMVTNPSLVNIHSSKNFNGFDVLLYHGSSYDYYADKVEAIRLNSPDMSSRYELVMKLLLKKRHLAPTHESTLTIPDPKNDFLTISKIPDFFISGHVHNVAVTQIGKTTNILSGTWIAQTPYQDKFGHVSQPGKVVVVSLKTRKAKVMKFVE